MIAPKPEARPDRVSLRRYWKLFRKDVLSAQPERLYSAKMAEFRTPFFRSFLVNEPELVQRVLVRDAERFPKSERVTRGLRPLLGKSIFVSNGEVWKRQRRMIDPAFEGGRVREMFPAMLAAAEAMVARLEAGTFDAEELASHATADVIFRTLFSIPIEEDSARRTYQALRTFQRSQPVAVASALLPWLPTLHRRRARREAEWLRGYFRRLTQAREEEMLLGNAPDDLATKLFKAVDPETGQTFSEDEIVDQVAIFFLAGHETSAALLGWALWLLAAAPEWGERVADEAQALMVGPAFARLSEMKVTRNVLRETLRLYPPVPMYVREASVADEFRERKVKAGDQVVVSPWHLQRNPRFWEQPDAFFPDRWDEPGAPEAFLPFSKGQRVCPGAGFAMAEAAILLAALMAAYRFEPLETPVPVAHLTVRAQDGIRLRAVPRGA